MTEWVMAFYDLKNIDDLIEELKKERQTIVIEILQTRKDHDLITKEMQLMTRELEVTGCCWAWADGDEDFLQMGQEKAEWLDLYKLLYTPWGREFFDNLQEMVRQ